MELKVENVFTSMRKRVKYTTGSMLTEDSTGKRYISTGMEISTKVIGTRVKDMVMAYLSAQTGVNIVANGKRA